MNPIIKHVVSRIPAWHNQPITVEPIRVGRTNTNFKVTVAGRPYFVRTPGPANHLLGLDAYNEYYNGRLAARRGLAPRILYYLAREGILVLEYIEAVSLYLERFERPELQTRLIAVMQKLHGGPPMWRTFSMVETARHYLHLTRQRGLSLPPAFDAYQPLVREIERVLAARPVPLRPCHNDIAPENVLDTGERLLLVDFDYSGNNDPFFELGNLCAQMGYDDSRLHQLVGQYCGGSASPGQIARTYLHALLSDLGWTLWCVIQTDVSPLAFDFRAYALARWARLRARLDSPAFEQWLRQVYDA